MVRTYRPLGTAAPFVATRLLGLLIWLLLTGPNGIVADQITTPIYAFKSRPDLYSPVLTLELREADRLSSGYIFVGPYESENPGPHIYDNEGNLVWSGWGQSGSGNVHAPHVCDYRGAPHLCFFQGNQQKGYCRGHGIIMDNRYRIVRSVQAGGGMSAGDMHEFKLINGGKSALMTVYQQRQYDMSRWNVRTGISWIMESVFQEVDVETSEVLFEWRSLDHVDPSMSYTYPAATDTSGDGLNPHSPWDYFHINSIDKNEDGDYLISSRHTSAIYKISGRNGSIIWRLNGATPSFRNINFSFSQQHDARWLSENTTHSVISLYNNGYNGYNQTNDYSSGMIILIDHIDMTATMIREYAPAGKLMLSSSQGNLQVLPNGNVFMGWGNNAFISEHDENGELVLWGNIATEIVMNYRAQKFEWDANPTDSPALWTYSKALDDSSPMMLYASWNGATRVKSWRFYGSMQEQGPFEMLAVAFKRGFETDYEFYKFFAWCYVEALDGNGEIIGRSSTRQTFVPSPELSTYCEDTGCVDAVAFGYPGEDNPTPAIPPPIEYGPDGYHHADQPVEEGTGSNTPKPPAPDQIFEDDHTSDLSWIIPAAWLSAVAVVVVAIAVRRIASRRNHHHRHTSHLSKKDHDSNDGGSEDEPESCIPNGKPEEENNSVSRDALPWWHWRRRMMMSTPQKYYPLDSMGEPGGSSSA